MDFRGCTHVILLTPAIEALHHIPSIIHWSGPVSIIHHPYLEGNQNVVAFILSSNNLKLALPELSLTHSPPHQILDAPASAISSIPYQITRVLLYLPLGWQGVTRSDGSVGELNNDGINADDGSDGGQEEFNHYKRPRQWWVPKRRWSRSAMIIPTTDASCWQWFFVHRATTCQGEEGVSNGRTGSKRKTSSQASKLR